MANDDRRKDEDKRTRDISDRETIDARSTPTSAPTTPRGRALCEGPFGPYRLIRKLGEGGFAQVWEAESQTTGRRLALKVLTSTRGSSPEALERFQREGRLAAQLNHPNCVYIFSAEEIEGCHTIAMELMGGGTLQDRLEKGPLPVRQAVDQMLDVLDGLEAAQQVGILHRDVKPSNCFIDQNGITQVGDFGISRILEMDSELTATGTFVGTPAYAAPEQVRGRDVEHRADLYSVGATLYALLTGRPPFEGQGGEVLARVLSETPTPFEAHAAAVPKGLQRVVLRLLHKEPGKRYQTYVALRAALLPFSSRGLSAATLGRRLLAGWLDNVVLVALTSLIWFGTVGEPVLTRDLRLLTLAFVLTWPVDFLYFFATENRWGGSPAKRLIGLRVATATGSVPSAGQILRRSVIYTLIIDLLSSAWIFVIMLERAHLAGLVGLVPLVLFVTMRKGNGYAGLHELLSGTRVWSVDEVTATSVPEIEPVGVTPEPSVPQSCGPYRVDKVVWQTEAEAFLLAEDDALNRAVWIHWFGDVDRAPPTSTLAQSRPGKLHWLQGSREAGDCWDAYAAPSGTSLATWVQNKGRLSWAQLLPVLVGLATELDASLDGASPQPKGVEVADRDPDQQHLERSISCVWIEARGQAKLVSFPISADGDEAPSPTSTTDWRELLRQVVLLGLEGRAVDGHSDGPRAPRAPMPESARPLVQRLCGLGQPFSSPRAVAGALHRLSGRPTRISIRRRMGPLAIACAPAAFVLAMLVMGTVVVRTASDETQDFLTVPQYVSLARRLDRQPSKPDDEAKREALRKVLASVHARVEHPGEAKPFGWSNNRELFEAAWKDYPELSEAELAEARRIVRENYPGMGQWPPRKLVEIAFAVSAGGLALLAPLAVILALVLRGPILFHLFGIIVQRSDGERAGRIRCLARALVAWSPYLATLVIGVTAIRLRRPGSEVGMWFGLLAVGLTLIAAAGAIFALLKPERGVADRVVGTHLVPR